MPMMLATSSFCPKFSRGGESWNAKMSPTQPDTSETIMTERTPTRIISAMIALTPSRTLR